MASSPTGAWRPHLPWPVPISVSSAGATTPTLVSPPGPPCPCLTPPVSPLPVSHPCPCLTPLFHPCHTPAHVSPPCFTPDSPLPMSCPPVSPLSHPCPPVLALFILSPSCAVTWCPFCLSWLVFGWSCIYNTAVLQVTGQGGSQGWSGGVV